jgi:hypothetical protein
MGIKMAKRMQYEIPNTSLIGFKFTGVWKALITFNIPHGAIQEDLV